MTTQKPVVVKQLPQQLKLGRVQSFLREIAPILKADRPRIVFDFSQVRQIDSAGVDMLLHCVEEAMKRDGDLKLAAVPPESAVILELTRVDRLFEVFETVVDAVDSFHGFPVHPRHDAYRWYLDSVAANGNRSRDLKMTG
jgi:anti-sigma B factor antagonist